MPLLWSTCMVAKGYSDIRHIRHLPLVFSSCEDPEYFSQEGHWQARVPRMVEPAAAKQTQRA